MELIKVLFENGFKVIALILLALVVFGSCKIKYMEEKKKRRDLEEQDEERIKKIVEARDLNDVFAGSNFAVNEIRKRIGKDYFNRIKSTYKTEGLIDEEKHIYDFLIKCDGKVYFNFQQYVNMCDKKVYEQIKKPIENISETVESKHYKKMFKKWGMSNIKRYTNKDYIDNEKTRIGIYNLDPIKFETLPQELQELWNVDDKKEGKKVSKNIYDVTEIEAHENFSRKFSKQSEYLKLILNNIK